MSEHLTAHERLHFDLERPGQHNHPNAKFWHDLVEEHGVALHAQALTEERLAESKRGAARLYDDLMRVMELASVLADNAANWGECEVATQEIRQYRAAYST